MKNKILSIFICMLTIMSCKIDDLNDSRKVIKEVSSANLLPNAQRALFNQMVTHGVFQQHYRLFAQYLAGTTFVDEETNYTDLKSFPTNNWSVFYKDVLSDLDLASTILQDEVLGGLTEEARKNRIAIIEILKVYTYHVLVDSYGDVPYTEALNIEFISPKYDDASDIYTDIIARLDVAISDLNDAHSSFGDADLVYDGDVSKWAKFANSLKLRLALRIADVDATKASAMASEAVNAGVFTSNEDNAALAYVDEQPNQNPAWFEIVNRGRTDYVAPETLVTTLLSLNDPRLPVYLDENVTPYVGGVFGDKNSFTNTSHISDEVLNATQEGVILDYAEVEFLLAEAAERSLVGGSADAEGHYNAAITASNEYWGVDSAVNTTYLTNPDVAYTTASGTWQEKIGTQKWIALFNRGFEGWSSYRRLGFPALPVTSVANNPVPRRVTYPIREYNTNNNNVSAAASKIGGDLLTTKVFWDAN